MSNVINNFEITNDFTITDGTVQIKTNDTTGSLDVSGNIKIGSSTSGNAKLIVENANNSIIELKANNANNSIIELKANNANNVVSTKSITNKSGVLEFTSNASLNTCLYEFNVGDEDSVGFMNSTGNNKPGIVFGRAGTGNLSVNDYSNAHIFYSTIDGGSDNNALNLTGEKLIFNTSTGNFNTPQQAMIIDQSGNVGIGTSSPGDKLTISGNGASGTGCIRFEDTDTSGDPRNWFVGPYRSDKSAFQIIPSSGQFGVAPDVTKALCINYNGNVGIGTSSPTHKLQIKGGAISAKACQLMIENEGYNKGIEFRYKSDLNEVYDFPQAKIYTSSSGSYKTKLHFSTAVGTNNANTTAVEVMTLNSAGNVGIGTSSPSTTLDVSGIFYNSISSGDTIAKFSRVDTDTHIRISGYDGYGTLKSSKQLNFQAGDNENSVGSHMLIDTDGNVGIGTTSPSKKLEVAGHILATDGWLYTTGNTGWFNSTHAGGLYMTATKIVRTWDSSLYIQKETSGTSDLLYLHSHGTNNALTRIKFVSQGAGGGQVAGYISQGRTPGGGLTGHEYGIGMGSDGTTLWVTNGGRVGIGTSSPSKTLDVSGIFYNSISGGDTIAKFSRVDTDTHIRISGHLGYGTLKSSKQLNFQAGDNENSVGSHMLIDTDGNVGIGTTSPDYQLHIVGGELEKAQVVFSGHEYGLYINTTNRDDKYCARFDGNGQVVMYLKSSGNVGIGTISPDYNLQVVSGVSINDPDFSPTYWYGSLYCGHVNGGITMGRIGPTHTNCIQSRYANIGSSLVINPFGGNVGIGTTSPSHKLDVNGIGIFRNALRVECPNASSLFPLTVEGYHQIGNSSVVTYMVRSAGGESSSNYSLTGQRVVYDAFLPSTTDSWTNYNSSKITIYSEFTIWSRYGVLATSSDKRIKENIRDVSDNFSLQQLRDISCCFYEYKDKITRSSGTTIGFIAQQVRKHLPMAVSLQKEIIPNEMRVIETPQWTTITDESGNNKYKLTITDLEDVSGNTKYKFYVSNGDEEKEKYIISLENEPKSFMFDEKWDGVFLYGKEVNDFHILDKQKIFSVAFSATQEIDRIQQQEKTKLIEQETKLATAEAKLATTEAKLATAEAKLATAEAKLATAETEIATLKNNDTVLLNKIATLESNFYNLQQQVQALINNQ